MQTNPTQETKTRNALFNVFPFYNRAQAAFIIFVLAVIFYSPSYNNEFALDDGITIHQNDAVLKGVKGIRTIMTKDTYHSFYERMNASDQLQGGRYRPLPVLTYAIEQEFIGTYRSGYYLRCTDLDSNGVLDENPVQWKGVNGKIKTGYEYNAYADLNSDGKAQENECTMCWDRNRNFKNDLSEDLNADGVFNEYDCYTYGASFRHFNNIALYALCCVLLYVLFSGYFFQDRQDLAFLAALLFTIHPVHSEVVANIKGRDEILSMIFAALTFIFAFRYVKSPARWSLAAAPVCLLCALMSKEFSVALFLLVPLSLFVFSERESVSFKGLLAPTLLFAGTAVALIAVDVSGVSFMSDSIFYLIAACLYILLNSLIFLKTVRDLNAASLMVWLFNAGIFYLCLRLNAVNMAPGVPDTEILNNPYLLATASEAFATQIYTLLIYLRIFLFPHPLVSDYSYATIAYRDLSDIGFVLSALINAALAVTGIVLCARRHLLGFALVTWYAFLIFVSNIFFPTGVMLTESNLFHAGMGMSIVFAWLVLWLLNFIPEISIAAKRIAAFVIAAVLIILCGNKAWERSRDWKNDVTLFLKDVKNAPNSVLVLGNAGARWIDLADTREITGVAIPGSDTTRFNDYNGQLVITDDEMREGGHDSKREAAIWRGIGYLQHAVELHPRYVNGFLNLGLAYFKLNMENEAIINWKYAEYLYPQNPYLLNYYYVYGNILRERAANANHDGNCELAIESLRKLVVIKPGDAAARTSLRDMIKKCGK